LQQLKIGRETVKSSDLQQQQQQPCNDFLITDAKRIIYRLPVCLSSQVDCIISLASNNAP
jgi:hypothetical protein